MSIGPLAQRFEDYHAANLHVYAELVRLAREFIAATGSRKIGMKALIERARWELALQTSHSDYLINNSFAPFYSRLIEFHEPDLRGVFELRHSDEANPWILGKIDEAEGDDPPR